MSTSVYTDTIFEEAKTPFRWYDNQFKRNRYKAGCRVLCDYRLITPNDWLLPFTIVRNYKTAAPLTWIIRDQAGYVYQNLSIDLLNVKEFDEGSIIYYMGALHGYFLECGFYTSEITDGVTVFYSEDFFVPGYTLIGDNRFVNPGFDNLSGGDFPGWSSDYDFISLLITPYACWNIGGTKNLWQDVLSEPDQWYIVSFELISVNVASSITVKFGQNGDVVTIAYPQVGRMHFIGKNHSGGTYQRVLIEASADFEGCIDNAECYRIEMKYRTCFNYLKWWNSCGMIGNLYYNTGYQNIFFMEEGAEPERLLPRIIESGYENREKTFFAEFQKRVSEYTINMGLLPAYIVDAIGEMPMHDTIQLFLANGFGSTRIERPVFTAPWDPEGYECLGTGVLRFQKPERSLNDGCCEDFVPVCGSGCDPLFSQFEIAFDSPIHDLTYETARQGDWTINNNQVEITHSDEDDFFEWQMPVVQDTWYVVIIDWIASFGAFNTDTDPVTQIVYHQAINTYCHHIFSGSNSMLTVRTTVAVNETTGNYSFRVFKYTGCWNVPPDSGVYFRFGIEGLLFVVAQPVGYGPGLDTAKTHTITVDVASMNANTQILLQVDGNIIYTITSAGVYVVSFDPRNLAGPLVSPLSFNVIHALLPGGTDGAVLNSVTIESCTFAPEV